MNLPRTHSAPAPATLSRFAPPRLRPLAAALIGALLGVGAPSSATAQSVLPTVEVTATGDDQDLGLNRPSTSGSRTGITTQELPASLDHVSRDTWEQRGDQAMTDIVGRTTGITPLSSPGNGGMSFTTRGFTGVNSVGIAEDGVRMGVASGTVNYPSDGWGYERIEVLRGPASIVYGSGTVGATINAVRKQPSRERAHEILLGAGEHGSAQLGLGTTGPIGEIASYRVDVYGHYTDGERKLGRASGGKLMSTLRLQPSSALRFELLADISDQKPERYFGTPVVNGRIVSKLRDQNYNFNDSIVHYQDQRLRGRIEWQATDWLSVRNELYHFSSDRQWRNIEGYRYDPAAETVDRYDYLEILHDLKQTGNRLEAALRLGEHSAVVGWEVSKAEFTHDNNSPYGGASVVSAIDPIRGYWSSPDPTLRKIDTDTTQHAFYLENAWRFHPHWQLLAGIRRDLADYSRSDRLTAAKFDKTLGGTAWRLGLSHQVRPGINLYGQVSQGHDPVTSLLTLNLANRKFKLTTARQIEAGIKQQFAQGLGEWTAAAYRIEKDDIITRDPERPSIAVQGGKQSASGLELNAILRPHAQWRLEGNYAIVRARFDELIEAGGADRSGNRPANVPRQTANLWAHYSQGDWQFSLGARHVGERFANNANTVRTASYTVFDSAIAWQIKPGATLRLLGRNLGDKLYSNAAVSGTRVILGDQRRFDLTAEFTF